MTKRKQIIRTVEYLITGALITMAHAQPSLYPDEFPPGDVSLLNGTFKTARDLNIKTSLAYKTDRLLAPYRKEAGLAPKDSLYKNRDGPNGYVGRHCLSALAMNAATGNAECTQRMCYFIAQLKECAAAKKSIVYKAMQRIIQTKTASGEKDEYCVPHT